MNWDAGLGGHLVKAHSLRTHIKGKIKATFRTSGKNILRRKKCQNVSANIFLAVNLSCPGTKVLWRKFLILVEER